MERNIDSIWNDMIIRFLNGELNLLEEEALLQWLKEKPERLVLFEELRYLWLSTSVKAVNYKTDPDKAWQKVDKLLQHAAREVQMNNSQSNQGSNSLKRILSIAAALVLVFILGALSSRFVYKNKTTPTYDKICEIVTPLGSKTSIFLPDGTHVWLNAGSKLTYDRTFGVNDRRVYLEGEAYFKVTTNKSKPFLVHTSRMDVKALGTTFNVKAYLDEKLAVATLVEGIIKVDVTGQDKNNVSYTLKPCQKITVINDNVTINGIASANNPEPVSEPSKSETIKPISEKVFVAENIKTELYTSWKDKRWEIEGEELGSLAVMLERRFNVAIHFKSEKLKLYKFTGIIQNETLEQVMEILRLTTPLKYTLGKGEGWLEIDPRLLDNYSRILEKK